METFTSFKEWLIHFEGVTPERAKVQASNLRFAEKCLGQTRIFEDACIHELYRQLLEAYNPIKFEACKPIVLTSIAKIFRYAIVEPELMSTYKDENASEKRLKEIQTALINYFKFLSHRFVELKLEDIQGVLQELDKAPSVVKRLTKWKPEAKLPKESSAAGKMFTWMGWKFHNLGLSALFRKFKITVLPQGDEEMIQIPMAQFHRFLEEYMAGHKVSALADIYSKESFILNKSTEQCVVLTFDEAIGRSMHLYAGEEELHFNDVENLSVDAQCGILKIATYYYKGCSIN